MKHINTNFNDIVGKTIVGVAADDFLPSKMLIVCSDGSIFGLRAANYSYTNAIESHGVKLLDFMEDQLVSSGASTVEEARAVYDAERARWQNHQDEIDRQTFDRLRAKFGETK